MLIVLLGGARSGKSTYAETLGQRHAGGVTYIATAPRIPGDDELDDRIDRHRHDRPDHWTTIEEQLDLAQALTGAADSLAIVDCLTTWVGNLQHHGRSESDVLAAVDAAIAVACARVAPTIVVTNEVGLGIVPAAAPTREYRDLLGRVNQRWVAAAGQALLMVAGRAIPLHDPDDLLDLP